ncbi:hypothetical protein H2O64_04100 [Kordia sp. YSTF-M3]|uniref:Uncharacterized protein n=1 Tax=Kordia aestuariivivens TaxID=2759037 RepID=A0ABR7Q5R5_9FLAO|nr:hypothetical protein [Kordia aestuariivivens]MBC8753838.1 hypothetical protein [Kordia aestuariivivens]
MKTAQHVYKTNRDFGILFLIFGITLICHSISDFSMYNYSDGVLFLFMRSNSSIVAEFIFGFLLFLSGILIFTKSKIWLNILKILTIAVTLNILFFIILKIIKSTFQLDLIILVAVPLLISFGLYKLTEYLVRVNNASWNFKTEKINLIMAFVVGLLPFLFSHIFFLIR